MKYINFARMTEIILLKSSYKRNRRRLGENRLRRTTCKMTIALLLVGYNMTVFHMFDVPFKQDVAATVIPGRY